MSFAITIWNSRGAFLEDDSKKQEIINRLADVEVDNHYVLIQEAGVGQEGDERLTFSRTHKYFQQFPYTASHRRCTLALIIPNGRINDPYDISCGFEDRHLFCMNCNDFILANIHAPSGVPRFAVSCVGHGIDNLNRGSMPWILAGDFNSDPSLYTEQWQTGHYCSVHPPGDTTHHGSDTYDPSTLDFLICHNSFGSPDVEVTRVSDDTSDHDIVTYIFS